MPKIHGFDYTVNVPTTWAMDDAALLVKRSPGFSRLGPDVLLKDKNGYLTHEIYNFAKLDRWIKEHTEGK